MRLKIGCKTLDDLLDGGVESGALTEFYGEAGSGKTNICLQLARNCAEQGKKVVYIDTEGVSTERLKQICGSDFENTGKNILFFEPYSLDEQDKIIDKAVRLAEGRDVGLIVLDSATMFYRHLLGNGHDVESLRMLSQQITKLLGVARKKFIPVVITSQVFTNIEKNEIEPLGGQALKHSAKAIIRLDKLSRGRRKATIIKHRALSDESCAEFALTNNGVEPAKKISMFSRSEKA
ncbi:MAG: DNA repair and recombination protein RadB [Thermoplasmatales archaeon]|nr:DNA repair and recombination protein RadB [Thermoplasmatales archaeon]